MTGKKLLEPIVKMAMGLREAHSACVREDAQPDLSGQSEVYFAHEELGAY